MFKILRATSGGLVFTLIGQIDGDNLAELKLMISAESETAQIVLDLKDLTLVNQEAVEYLGQCETNGVSLRNCPMYIRRWIDLSRTQKLGRRQ
jgi:anti-anti-sigma regulatory factor